MASRPYKLNDETIKRMAYAAKLGAKPSIIAHAIGVDVETIYRWTWQAKKDRDAGIASIYTAMLDALDVARFEGAKSRLKKIKRLSSDGDPNVSLKATIWQLEHLDGYGSKKQEPADEPEPATTTAALTPEQLLEAARALPPDVLRRALSEAQGETDADPDR